MVSYLLSKIRTKGTKPINNQPITEAWRGSLPCWGHGTSWAEAKMWPLVFWRLAVLAPDQREQWGKDSSHFQGVLPTKMLSVPAQHTLCLGWALCGMACKEPILASCCCCNLGSLTGAKSPCAQGQSLQGLLPFPASRGTASLDRDLSFHPHSQQSSISHLSAFDPPPPSYRGPVSGA